jgi:hypothetical protein
MTRTQNKTLVNVGNVPSNIWTDYQNGSNAISIVQNPFYDLGSRMALYYGTADARVCDQANNWNPWGGTSVRFTRLVPDGNTYKGWAATWFINIKYPNWTCDATVSQCYNPSPSLVSYAFVGATPLIPWPASGTIYFLSNTWGGWYPD